ncbi:MAG: RagB/SusD family nutrient uptake outer membrane protein [Flavobacteriales bacterium]|nr:RagB/SusD family nutrient uptake outer membrane protein [Flavobacteriales bacterium]
MKKLVNNIVWLAALLVVIPSCEVEDIVDPNGPSAESFAQDATSADLQLLVSGLQAIQRLDLEFYFESVSLVGREYWDLNNIDPRYTAEILGKNGVDLDNNGFLTTRAFAAKHRAMRNAHILIEAAENGVVSAEASNGYTGFAKTVLAYEKLLELNRQYENGVRIDTSDPENLGPYSAGYQAGLDGIRGILDDGYSDLQNAGSEFDFNLSTGYAGFDDPAGMAQVNRAIAARISIYQNDASQALTDLNNSFFDINGDLSTGAYHSFSLSANDQVNPLFYVSGPDQDRYAIHPTFLADAEAGDTRVAEKTEDWGTTVSADGLDGTHGFVPFDSNTDMFPIIRNEELILIYAEANINSNPAESVNAINVIRTAAGLGPYIGAITPDALVDEILMQRRYSLVGEGHYWVDMRRYDRLDELPIDRPGDTVHTQFPRPIAENE